jgi:DNA-binding IclR family transcriptional regulator
MCKTEKSRIAQELLSYLARHPDAQDTLDGICEWWLLEEKIKRRKAEIREVLGDLVRSGLVMENPRRDERTRYLLNRPAYELSASQTRPDGEHGQAADCLNPEQ